MNNSNQFLFQNVSNTNSPLIFQGIHQQNQQQQSFFSSPQFNSSNDFHPPPFQVSIK
jgi:hypothetical protein